jgi:hypothetical protein
MEYFVWHNLLGFGIWWGSQFPYKNSRVKKLGIQFASPLIDSISKSKELRIACHLAKIYFDAIFLTSLNNISFTVL